ncbi:MAG: hypothetical protein WCE45_06215 [Sedimentisphaerales bacterium]
MAKLKITAVLLLLCLLFLCVFFLTAKSLIVNEYDGKQVAFLKNLAQTRTGQFFIRHYTSQLNFLAGCKLGEYNKLNSSEKVYFELSRWIFIGLAVRVVWVISAVLMIMYCISINSSAFPTPRKYTILISLLVILNGTIVRLIMASAFYGNIDMRYYEVDANFAMTGDNIYAHVKAYNYTPVWLMTLGFLKYIQLQMSSVSFHFVVRSFLCLADIVTLVFLLLIANLRKISLHKVALLFYLNPVSFLITGYHGQFDNLAVLMVVIGLFIYLKLNQKSVWGIVALWLLATAGMIIKHNIFYELIICLNSAIKRYRIKLLLFAVSVCLFLVTFIPYWSQGSQGIIENVFQYSSAVGEYGFASLLGLPQFKYLFITGMFVFPFLLGGRDIIRQCLLGFLFFVSFTSGWGIQYFVLPLAVGSLYSSKGFLFYCLLASEFILENKNNVFVPGLNIHVNVVWLCALFWFFSELWYSRRNTAITAAQKLT